MRIPCNVHPHAAVEVGQGALPYTCRQTYRPMNDYDVIAAVDACLALRDITVTFLYISPQPHFNLEPDYVARKPIK